MENKIKCYNKKCDSYSCDEEDGSNCDQYEPEDFYQCKFKILEDPNNPKEEVPKYDCNNCGREYDFNNGQCKACQWRSQNVQSHWIPPKIYEITIKGRGFEIGEIKDGILKVVHSPQYYIDNPKENIKVRLAD